jgi:hypothetical protein
MLEVSRDAAAAGEEQLGRCTAGYNRYCRLYVSSGKLILAAMYLNGKFELLAEASQRRRSTFQ